MPRRANTHLGSGRRTRLRLNEAPQRDLLGLFNPIPGLVKAAAHPAASHPHDDGGVLGAIGDAIGSAAHAVGHAAGSAIETAGRDTARAYHQAVYLRPPPALRAPFPNPASPVALRAPEASALGSYLGRLLTPGGALSALLGGTDAAPGKGGPVTIEDLYRKNGYVKDPGFNTWRPTSKAGVDNFSRELKAIEAKKGITSPAALRRWETQPDSNPATAVLSSNPSRPAHAPVDPQDPLGPKTLGDVNAAELARARRLGTVRVSKQGVITTPAGRNAVNELRAARQYAGARNRIETGLGPNADAFAKALADYTHLNPRAVGAWVASEGGAYEAGGAAGPQNWLGVGYPGHPTPFGQSPNFSGTPERAGRATGAWMEGKIGAGYGYRAAPGIQAIVPAAAHAGPRAFVDALSASGWGTDVSHVQQNLASVRVHSDPQAVKALQVAKQNARAEGINPTPFNGDVTGGQGDTVYIRADAKGAVQWAESALGTREGSRKQLHWAGKFGLGSSQPWCANFVSAMLSRRGVEPAPNPNFVPSYESEWNGGRNIGTDLSKAKPGDLVAFSGQHIGVYVGNGEMISGNFGDEVSRDPVSADSSPISAILRPNYKGGKVAVHESAYVPGSTSASTFGAAGVAGGVGVGTGSPAAAAATQRPSVALTQLAAPLSAGPTLPDAYLGGSGEEAHASAAADTITALLGEEPLTPTRRPTL